MIFDLLRTPSSFEGQPGHAGVGMLLAWFLGAWLSVTLGVDNEYDL